MRGGNTQQVVEIQIPRNRAVYTTSLLINSFSLFAVTNTNNKKEGNNSEAVSPLCRVQPRAYTAVRCSPARLSQSLSLFGVTVGSSS